MSEEVRKLLLDNKAMLAEVSRLERVIEGYIAVWDYLDELELIGTPHCWNCDTNIPPLYVNHEVNGDRERATTCLKCYAEEYL